jgi:outer membrane protein
MAAGFDVDVASTTIRVAESSLLPTITVQGSASTARDNDPTLASAEPTRLPSFGQLNQPIYDGGTAASRPGRPRSSPRKAGWCWSRSATRPAPRPSAPGSPTRAPRFAVSAAESEVRAAASRLPAYKRKRPGGQRTTVDVLNSQQDPNQAKARLIGAQRDRVIASYTLLSAIGRLDVKTLNLNTPDYLPEVHYHQVRDAWHGLRTPSGQ